MSESRDRRAVAAAPLPQQHEGRIPISPALPPAAETRSGGSSVGGAPTLPMMDRRVVVVSALAVLIAACAVVLAHLLTALIALVTNVAFFGHASTAPSSPAGHHRGLWVIVLPAIGGLIVGAMARYGSRAIRGHGIPEAMEQILLKGSRIPPRITLLKPLSSAVAIGTGGPFGAEGPIIATGAAFGSLIGQLLHTTASERKTLLAAGAAAGMTAIFGTPIAAILLAVELLLFEFRARSLVPGALACATAAGLRSLTASGAEGMGPVFALSAPLAPWTGPALLFYAGLGAAMGLAAVGVTRLVYFLEDAFERLPVPWVWWPALGGLVVGIVGWFAPRTLGVGYDNITDALNGTLAGGALLFLVAMKLLSWSVSLSSGTSGGTLAPLLTIGGGLGAVAGGLAVSLAPHAGIDPRIAALVGMAALFAGAARALLTSVVFAFETTLQPMGLVPLLGGCTASFLVSSLLMPNTIMTEKIVRRGVRVPSDYEADFLTQATVADAMTADVATLAADSTVAEARRFLRSGALHSRHQGYPIVDEDGHAVGVLTRRDLLTPEADESATGDWTLRELVRRPALTIGPAQSLREAADRMVSEDVGRLVILAPERPHRVVGIVTRGDLLRAHGPRLHDAHRRERHLRIPRLRKPAGQPRPASPRQRRR